MLALVSTRHVAAALAAATLAIACLVLCTTATAQSSSDQAKGRRDQPATTTTTATPPPAKGKPAAKGKPKTTDKAKTKDDNSDRAKDRKDTSTPTTSGGTSAAARDRQDSTTANPYPDDGGGSFTGSVTKKVVKALFGGVSKELTTHIVDYLAYTPKYSGGEMNTLHNLVQGLAFGLLGIVMTMTVARFYLTGMTNGGNGGIEAFDGLVRVTWAVLMVLAWPWLFDNAVNLSNLATTTISHSHLTTDNVEGAAASQAITSMSIPGIGMLLSALSGMVQTIMFLSLLLMKMVLVATNAFLFAAMPLAIVLSPVPELAWLSRTAMRSAVATWVIPVIWAILFASAAIIQNTLFGVGDVVDDPNVSSHLIRPLIGIGMLMAALSVPRRLLQTAMHDSGVGSRGGMGQFLSFAASQLATGFVRSQVPQSAGGSKQPDRWSTFTRDGATGRWSEKQHVRGMPGTQQEADLNQTMREQAHADAKAENARYDERQGDRAERQADRTERQGDRQQRLDDRDANQTRQAKADARQQAMDQQRQADRTANQQRQANADARQKAMDAQRQADRLAAEQRQADQGARQAARDAQQTADRDHRTQREAAQDQSRADSQQERRTEQAMRYTPPARSDGVEFHNNHRYDAEHEYSQWRAQQGVSPAEMQTALAQLPDGYAQSVSAASAGGDPAQVTEWRDRHLQAAASQRMDPAVRDAHRTLAAGATQWLSSRGPTSGGTP